MATVRSKLAVAKSRPFGDQEQDLTVRVCVPSRIAAHRQLPAAFRVQMRTVLSPLQLARASPEN